MKISSLNFKNNLRGNAVLSLIHGKEMILKNEVKDFLTKEFADQGFDETIIFEANESDGLLSAIRNNLGGDLFGSQLIIKDEKLDFQEGSYSINDLNEASSIWFTSTTKGIVGVEEIVNLETKINPECELLEICKDAFVKKYFS